MTKVVLVSYAFPPVGGAGVQRAVKLVKYLPQHGVEATVLTTMNPSVPVTDSSLLGDVPAGTRIVRARTFEPSYGVKQAAWTAESAARPSLASRAKKLATRVAKEMLVPDAQVLWLPAAAASLAEILSGDDRPDALLVSGPPFSSFLLAAVAKLRGKTRIVLDYRDEWTAYKVGQAGDGANFEMVPTTLRRVTSAMERAMLRLADHVVTATEAFRENLLATFSFVDPSRVTAIPNGYDPDDIPSSLPTPPADKLVLTYAGTVFRLTSPRGLLGAVRKIRERSPELARRLDVRFFGRIVDTETALFEGLDGVVSRLGYIDHARVLPELARSHLVLCLLDDVAGAERIYPAKIFELMALARPVLTLSPEGALADLVRETNLGAVIAPRDEEKIALYLEDALRAHAAGTLSVSAEPRGIERYHRSEIARQFATALRG